MEAFTVEFIPHPRPDKQETQNTLRFVETDGGQGLPPIIGGLYIQKWKLKGACPRRVRVTVEIVE